MSEEKSKEKGKSGRPGKYEVYVQPHLERIKAWCRDGAIDEMIAEKLGISYSSFKNYKKAHQELRDALMESKADIDDKVVNALLKNALGYEVEETETHIKRIDGREYVEKVTTKKQIPGDFKAQVYWLKNRRGPEWRNDYVTNKVEVSGSINNPFEGMSTDELKKMIQDD